MVMVCRVDAAARAAFQPKLNSEHREARWWPLAGLPPPQQLHPVVVRPAETDRPMRASLRELLLSSLGTHRSPTPTVTLLHPAAACPAKTNASVIATLGTP